MLQALLDRMTYKKGWTFRLEDRAFARPMLITTVQVEDTYNPGVMSVVSSSVVVPPFFDDERWMTEWLFNEIRRIEIHEAQEWFKIDGEIYDDPHNPRPRTPLPPLTQNLSGAKTMT